MGETLAVIDLDRTLIDTEQISRAFARAVSEYGHYDAEQLDVLKHKAQDTSQSFHPYIFIRNVLTANDPSAGEVQLKEVEERFYELAATDYRDKLLYSDALPFLKRLAAEQIPTLIMTYGYSEWQQIKLRAVGLDVWPHIITADVGKGSSIASWRNKDGQYIPPDMQNPQFFAGNTVLTRVALVDDKGPSFRGLPDDSLGFLLRRPEEKVLPSQQGEVPSFVRIVGSLAEIETTALRQEGRVAA